MSAQEGGQSKALSPKPAPAAVPAPPSLRPAEPEAEELDFGDDELPGPRKNEDAEANAKSAIAPAPGSTQETKQPQEKGAQQAEHAEAGAEASSQGPSASQPQQRQPEERKRRAPIVYQPRSKAPRQECEQVQNAGQQQDEGRASAASEPQNANAAGASTPAVRIDGLVRPFTEGQLRELIQKTGKIMDMWMPNIKVGHSCLIQDQMRAQLAGQGLVPVSYHFRPSFPLDNSKEKCSTAFLNH
jgi:hypothetical protein